MSKVTGLVALDLESQHWGGVSSAEQSTIKTGEVGTDVMIFVIMEKAFNIIWLTFHEKTSQSGHRRGLSYLLLDSN